MTRSRKGPPRAPVLGFLLLCVSVPLYCGGGVVAFGGLVAAYFVDNQALAFGICLGGLAVVAVGAFFFALGRRLRAKTIEDDERDPILYCRPFSADDRVFTGASEEEEGIVSVFRPLGPVVTVGRPRDLLRGAGAPRIYFEEADWRQGVESLMARARLVLIKAAVTEYVLWEFKTATERVGIDRIVLIVPDSKDVWMRFREAVDWLELPSDLRGAHLVCFDHNSVARLVLPTHRTDNWWDDRKLVLRLLFTKSLPA